METNQQIINQQWIEEHYNRRLIGQKVREVFNDPAVQTKIDEGVELVNGWINTEFSYDSKNNRVAQLKMLDVRELVTSIFEGIAFVIKPELLTSVTAQMASHLGFSDKVVAIQTTSELLAVLCNTNLFDIYKESKHGSLKVISNIELPADILKDIENSEYLSPMVCEPLELTNNRSSGYLTEHGVSLILGGAANHHTGDICLDVLNTMNRVKLTLNTEFLSYLEEDSSEITVESIKKAAAKKGKILTTVVATERLQRALENWDHFKKTSYEMYTLIVKQGNEFHLTHRVDKRGRIYAQGYHISTMGTSFKKAMIDLVEQEKVDVPDEYLL